MPDYLAVAAFLDDVLGVSAGLPPLEDTRYRVSARPIARLGLALEPDFDVGAWARDASLDAVFLHRPWKLDLSALPPDVGVLMAHASFDDHLTLGVNPRLAEALGFTDWQPFGEKEGQPIGMLGQIPPAPFDTLRESLESTFAGIESAHAGAWDTVTTVAIVNAMTDTLVREAATGGAQVYVTGQGRAPARPAVEETGLGVFAVGHRRCEQWGLRALAGMLRERWPTLGISF